MNLRVSSLANQDDDDERIELAYVFEARMCSQMRRKAGRSGMTPRSQRFAALVAIKVGMTFSTTKRG